MDSEAKSKEMHQQNHVAEAASLMLRSAGCYCEALALRPSNEAWCNLGVALERAAVIVTDQQKLMAPLSVFQSLRSLDSARADSVCARVLRHATLPALRDLCGRVPTGASSPVRKSNFLFVF